MKARVKATGEVFEIASYATIQMKCCDSYGEPLRFYFDKVEILSDGNDLKESKDPDYWDKLLHQYAGMAMQGLLASGDWDECSWDIIAEDAIRAATALVEKLKESKV